MSKRMKVTPSKGQAKMSFFVGIIFCCIGVFVAIPTVGPFGILWTAIAAWITYVNFKNGFTDDKIATRVIEIDEDEKGGTIRPGMGYGTYTYTKENTPGESIEERLIKLQRLYDQALITKEEYEQKKKDILDKL